MPHPKVTVAVPTLADDETLAECLQSLERQTLSDFEVIVVDNSGRGKVASGGGRVRVIRNARNVGFGAAVNQAFRESQAPYLAVLNDDAVADPEWLARMVACAEANPSVGMLASEVQLGESGTLDSAGMVMAADGSSKQRGHGQDPAAHATETQALFPSGSAALYRRAMLDQIGMFDEEYFLYCEDTDLGLRGIWAGWECRYVPGAVVRHKYSHSAGRASLLKAYYVERNRLYTVIKTFPLRMLWKAPFAAGMRYFWHLAYLLTGQGKAAEFQREESGMTLPLVVLRAHAAALLHLPRLLSQRRGLHRRISAAEFVARTSAHRVTVREVAAH